MTLRFLVDEDLPRSTARALNATGYDALDVRDTSVRGRSDAEVFALAQTEQRIVVSADKGFANIFRFPVGAHAGIIVLRIDQSLPSATLNETLLDALAHLNAADINGSLIIVELHKVRIRRPASRV